MPDALLKFSLTTASDPNPRGRRALYQQIIDQIIDGLRTGSLKAGQRLPSSRVLAKDLHISRSVVVQAYDQLLAEGILSSQSKRGIYVAGIDFLSPGDTALNKPPPTSALQFDAGPDIQAFPNPPWAKCMRQAGLKPDPGVLGGEYPLGYPPLQQQICAYLLAHRGLHCEARQIVITSGVRESMTLVRHCLSRVVKHWWVEEPTFPPIRAALGSPQLLPVSKEGTRPPKSSHWAAVLTPCRQYPLGHAYGHECRADWLNALAEGRGFVVEDDYDNDFCYQGKPGIPLAQAAQNRGQASERLFFVGSFTKVLFRGLRLGFVVAPVGFIEQIHASQNTLGQSAALPMQAVVSEFIASGAFYRHINRMRRHYKLKRDYLQELLSQYLRPWFDWQTPSGGMHFLLAAKGEFNAADPLRKLQQAAIKLEQPIELFLLADYYQHPPTNTAGLIMGFTGIDEKHMLWGLQQLAKLLAHY